jgi:hypothetical protein
MKTSRVRPPILAVVVCAVLATRAAPVTAGGVVPIADIHSNLAMYVGQIVTVQGQVYIPNNYRQNPFAPSGYIQDGSGRGINLFGMTPANALLQDIGNVVLVQGEVLLFNSTTVEITSITDVELVSGGNPPLQPQHVTAAQANSSAWEGTYIEITGEITSQAPFGPARHYTVNDGSGTIVVRVVDALGLPQQPNGAVVTARGAGSGFNGQFQIIVGRQDGFFLDAPVAVEPSNWSAVKALFQS